MNTGDADDTRDRLHRAALRVTAGDPGRIGYWLARHRDADGLSEGELARKLGVDAAGLARLALCQTPHPDRFAADVLALAEATGASSTSLANLLRQEQALSAWAGQTGTATENAGWMLAAHDADQPPPGDDDEPRAD